MIPAITKNHARPRPSGGRRPEVNTCIAFLRVSLRASQMIARRPSDDGSTRFVRAVMDAYNDYKVDLKIIDVYVYDTPGKSVRATAMIIIKRETPKTLIMYYLANRSIIALIDVSNLIPTDHEGLTTYITVDLYKPPEEVRLRIINKGRNTFAFTHEMNEDKAYLIKTSNQYDDSLAIASIIKEIMDSYDELTRGGGGSH